MSADHTAVQGAAMSTLAKRRRLLDDPDSTSTMMVSCSSATDAFVFLTRVHVRRYLLTSAGKLCLRQKLWLYELIRPLASAEHICWRARLMLVQLLVWKICGALPIALCNNILLVQTSKLQICVQSALLLRNSSWHLAHCCKSQGQVYSGEYCQAGHMGCILL